MSAPAFGLPGGVDPDTGRMGLTIEQWSKTDEPDLPVYWYSPSDTYGDPWAYVDGIDLSVDGLTADVWFEAGHCVSVPVGKVVYMARKHAEPLLPPAVVAAGHVELGGVDPGSVPTSPWSMPVSHFPGQLRWAGPGAPPLGPIPVSRFPGQLRWIERQVEAPLQCAGRTIVNTVRVLQQWHAGHNMLATWRDVPLALESDR